MIRERQVSISWGPAFIKRHSRQRRVTIQGWVPPKVQGRWSGHQQYHCAICGSECGYCVIKPLTSKSQMLCTELLCYVYNSSNTAWQTNHDS